MRQTLLFLSLSILVLTSCQKIETIDSKISARPSGGNGGGGSTVNLTQGLVAFYPFNGNANDASGNGNNGTVYGATLTTDRFNRRNRAYSFNGSSYIQSDNWNSLLGNVPFTVSFWTNPSPSNNGWILAFGQPADGQGFCIGNWHWGGESLGGQIWKYNYISNTLTNTPFNTWTNILISYENSTLKAYKNGLLASIQTVDYTTTNLAQGIISIGKQNVFNEYYTGLLDDIRIYNRALNQAEITYLARN